MNQVAVVIPAYNEEAAIAEVVSAIPRDMVREVIVVDNGSTDGTAYMAKQAGAVVVTEPRRGYGRACWAGVRCLQLIVPDIVVFLDASLSFYPEDIPPLILPIVRQGYDLVIGSRLKGEVEEGSITPPQLWGTTVASRLVDFLYKVKYSDFGSFRAIRYDRLLALNMQEPDAAFGMEMQILAAKRRLKIAEVPVRYQKRIGTAKVAGTVMGIASSSLQVISTIANHVFMN